ncbi:CBS domain-containing protein [Rhodoblastus acidophilus]|uniref:CBS domain-containing protein n=1 Tax=Rhodoblastus acidophilus TaxID=1074 RepID=A0A212Q6C2_RHOAC|nr:CBS domain-containing protein [Rhodoblastus acidophilus]PPQ36336.1 inosine-5-monophosphate dehydrogenase [Rhodoblastus acidophilus]RAI19723.1 inosine-5-monophosphate dehydrogenase [Rhodoblastus acidophilus]SNB54893.1 CBS domain-containing protein [Rhodoblastus acidophilus]
MSVAQILAAKGPDVVTISPHHTLQEASAVLAERGIGAVIVSDGGDVLGIISERDIVREIGRAGESVLRDPVSAHMTSKIVTTEPGEAVDQVMEMMTRGRFRHLPVMDNRRLVGVVSIGDVVKYRLESMQSEFNAIRDYIATA